MFSTVANVLNQLIDQATVPLPASIGVEMSPSRQQLFPNLLTHRHTFLLPVSSFLSQQAGSWLQWQILDSVGKFLQTSRTRKNLKVIDRSADRNGKLMSVDDASEILSMSLPFCRLSEKIIVLAD